MQIPWEEMKILGRDGSGWIKYMRLNAAGQRCVLGLMDGVFYGDSFEHPSLVAAAWEDLEDQACKVLASVIRDNPEWIARVITGEQSVEWDAEVIASWNNHDDTTWEDVARALDLAKERQPEFA